VSPQDIKNLTDHGLENDRTERDAETPYITADLEKNGNE